METMEDAGWRLEPISGADRDMVEVIGLPPHQEAFAGSLDEVFRRLNEPGAVGSEQGFAVVEPDGEVVGFFVLREGLRRPPWARCRVPGRRPCTGSSRGSRRGLPLDAPSVRSDRDFVVKRDLSAPSRPR